MVIQQIHRVELVVENVTDIVRIFKTELQIVSFAFPLVFEMSFEGL